MAQRKWVKFEVIVDHSLVYDLMTLVENKAVAGSLNIRPVKHGGADDDDTDTTKPTNLKPVPSARDFLFDYIGKHDRILTKDVLKAGDKAGISKASIYSGTNNLVREGVLKRIENGVFVLAKKSKTAKPAQKERGRPVAHKEGGGPSASEHIIATIRSKQNGSGEGVNLSVIKDALVAAGFVPTGAGPALNTLLSKNKVVRVSQGNYRVPDSTGDDEHQHEHNEPRENEMTPVSETSTEG